MEKSRGKQHIACPGVSGGAEGSRTIPGFLLWNKSNLLAKNIRIKTAKYSDSSPITHESHLQIWKHFTFIRGNSQVAISFFRQFFDLSISLSIQFSLWYDRGHISGCVFIVIIVYLPTTEVEIYAIQLRITLCVQNYRFPNDRNWKWFACVFLEAIYKQHRYVFLVGITPCHIPIYR